MASFGDLVKTDDFKNEKHVPVIELPGGVKKDEAFDVVVSVGKEIAHPNTTAHFIQWIALYFKPKNGMLVELGRSEFSAHGATPEGGDTATRYTEPAACFRVKLDEPGELLAMSYCNIHGLWESSSALS